MALDRRVVAAGRRPGERGRRTELGDVVDRGPHEVEVGLERHAGRRRHPLDLAEQRDEVVRGDHRGRVVGGPVVVGHLERPAAEVVDHPAAPWGRPPPRTTRRRPDARAPTSGFGSATSGCSAPRRRGCGPSTSSPSDPARWATTVAVGPARPRRPRRRWHRRAWRSPGGRRPRPRSTTVVAAAEDRRSTRHPACASARAHRAPGPPAADHPERRHRQSSVQRPDPTRPGPRPRSLQLVGHQVGGQVGQRGHDEAALAHPGMRDTAGRARRPVRRSTQRTSTSSVRGPQRSSRTRPAADSSRWHTPSSWRADSSVSSSTTRLR